MASRGVSRGLLSLALSVAVASFYSLSSVAAIDPQTGASDNGPVATVAGPTGVVTGAGLITVNGHPTRSGATILSGSVIGTGSDGRALVDLGPLGRVRIEPSSSIELTFSSDAFKLKTICAKTHLEVASGQVEIRASTVRTLSAGETETLKSGAEVSAIPGSYLLIDCRDRIAPPGFVHGGVLSAAALIAVAGGVATGVIAGRGKKAPPSVSPRRP
jgi:hypothetical protein